MAFILVALGGGIGSLLRYSLSLLLPTALGQFPWPTWWANILGCTLAGLYLAFSEKFPVLTGDGRLFLLVGLLGGFTTFSSFSLETFNLLRHDYWMLAGSYVLSSLLVGLVCMALMYYIARWCLLL